MDRPSILKATLIGGATFGLLGSIPIVNAINCFCCALVMGGGFVAAYLYANDCKRVGVAFGAGHGAVVGLVAGVFYAIVNAIIEGLITIVLGRPEPEEVLDFLEGFDMPPEALDTAERVVEVLSSSIGVLILFGVVLAVSLVFSTIGGLIGGSVFKVAATPPAVPPGSTPAPPTFPPAGGGATPGTEV
jgi:hypothetical protein